MKTPVILCTAGLLALAFQSLHYYPLFPEVAASHFGVSGQANGAMRKENFFALMWLIYALVYLNALFITRLLPGRIKLRDRDYWLAPERREATLAAHQVHAAWEGTFTMAFFYIAMEFVARANLGGRELATGSFSVILGVFLGLIIVSRLRLRRKFPAAMVK